MRTVTLHGDAIEIIGDLPAVGSDAPDFSLVDADLKDVSLKDFSGKKLLNIVPSLDTDVCATSAEKFNQYAKDHSDITVLVISADLPFAQKRFCTEKNVDNVRTLSIMRSKNFSKDYGVLIEIGPLAGLTARAIVVIDENNKVIYTELVPEIAQEPDYDKALGNF